MNGESATPVMFVSFKEAAGAVYLFKRILEDRGIAHTHVVMGRQRWLTVLSTEITPGDIDRLLRIVRDTRPRVIAFSLTTTDAIGDLQKTAARIRTVSDAFLLAGGTGATLEPERVIGEVDGVCVGEGVLPFTEFIESYLQGTPYRQLQNFWFRDASGIVKNPLRPWMDVDGYPAPSCEGAFYQVHHGVATARREPAYAYTFCSVGCPMQCTYCSSPYLSALQAGTYFRLKSVPKIMEELRRYRSRGLLDGLFFYDEIFPWDERFLEEFCREYKATIGVPFACWGHPTMLTEKNVRMLADAGLRRVRMGVQTFSDRLRPVYGRRETNAQIIAACRLLKKYGIAYEIEFIIGPLDTARDFLEYLRWVPRVRGKCMVIFHNYCLLPKTKMQEYLAEHRRAAAVSPQWNRVANFNRPSGKYAYLHLASVAWFFLTHPGRLFSSPAMRALLCTQVTAGRIIFFIVDLFRGVCGRLRVKSRAGVQD